MSNKAIAGCVAGGVLALVLLVGVIFGWSTVPAGHIGVVTSYGQVVAVIEPGATLKFPWRATTVISLQTQEDREVASVPTKEGLTVELEASLLYSVEGPQAARELYEGVGAGYREVVVMPQFKSALRGITVKYDAKDLYTAHRAEIEAAMMESVTGLLKKYGIHCHQVLLRSITLPPTVRAAVERKLAAEQDAAGMEFVILKETKDAERKRVEAKGIADAQDIIHKTLTAEYLRYLWIKSLDNAASHSGTIIYVPTGQDGLPTFADISPRRQKEK